MVTTGYLEIIFRSIAVYIFIVIAIRIFGKKELSQMQITDLVLILLISNSVQNAMVGPDSSLLGGIVAAMALFLINYLMKFILYRSPKLTKILEGEAVILIYKGVVNQENLIKEKITEEELAAVVREHGVGGITQVEIAILERDGNISVVSKELDGQTYHRRRGRLHPKHKRAND